MMKNGMRRLVYLVVLPVTLLLLSGCDAADIVAASLDLAGAIINAAT